MSQVMAILCPEVVSLRDMAADMSRALRPAAPAHRQDLRGGGRCHIEPALPTCQVQIFWLGRLPGANRAPAWGPNIMEGGHMARS